MNRPKAKRTVIFVAGALAGTLILVSVLLLLRTRMQEQAGAVNTLKQTATASTKPQPSGSGTATPSASISSTPFVDPTTVQSGDRGLLVAAVQQRLYQLGYYAYKPTGYFAGMTQTAVRNFQTANHLFVDGVVSTDTLNALFSKDAKYAASTPVALPMPTPPTVRPHEYGKAIPFSQVNSLIPDGARILVIDLNSQYYFYATRQGGINHLEIAPASADDMQRYLSIFSGRSCLDKRACVVEYNDQVIAASLCGWLHGSAQTLDLYFFGSTADDSALQDAEHNANLLLSSNGEKPQ